MLLASVSQGLCLEEALPVHESPLRAWGAQHRGPTEPPQCPERRTLPPALGLCWSGFFFEMVVKLGAAEW